MNFLLLRRSLVSRLKSGADFQRTRNHVTTTTTLMRPRNHSWSPQSIRLRTNYKCLETAQFFSVATSADDEDEQTRNGDRSLLFSPLAGGVTPPATAAIVPPATAANSADSEPWLLLGANPSQNDSNDDSSDEGDDNTKITEPMFLNKKQSYMWNLKHYYAMNHDITITDDHFDDSMAEYHAVTVMHERIRFAWTSTFTCPVTKTTYSSGTLRENFTPLQGVGKIGDESIYYTKKVQARQAVVAKVLDAIQFEKTGLVEPRLCTEDPSQSTTQTSESNAAPSLVATMKAKLKKHYKDQFGVVVTNSSLKLKKELKKGGKIKYTGTFVCPVTGTLYPPGSLRNSEFTPLKGDKIFYYQPSGCVMATIARVLDVIQYQKDGVTEPRLCEEDPSLFKVLQPLSTASVDPPTFVDTDDDKAKPTQSMDVIETNLASRDRDPGSLLFAHNILESDEKRSPQHEDSKLSDVESSSTLFGSSAADIKDDEETEEVEDESDFVVSSIPVTVGRPPSHRLLEAASKMENPTPLSSSSNELLSPVSPSERTPTVSIGVRSGDIAQMAKQAARHWLKANSGTHTDESLSRSNSVHRLNLAKENSLPSLLVGKSILSALAAANQAAPLTQRQGIEGIARQVLEILWKSENSDPDADVYALYLKCFDQDPKVARTRAEQIVYAMKSGTPDEKTGRVLPEPNQKTINALIQISAQVGGTSGRYAKYTDGDFRPNRESFLAVLSSAVYAPTKEFEPGGFDIDFAQECVQRMSEIANETGDASLQPDAQVYNAPLRWSGGPELWAESRPYARSLPWDSYQKMFSKGLRKNVEEDDLCVKEATDMERWLNKMEEQSSTNKSISPNIETYEAIIQGWIRTVTREGLERAESIVERLLPESVGSERSTSISAAPRLQTFHPILAAWYHSGEPDAPSKVVDWIGRCEKISDAGILEDVMLDSRILELKMMAIVKEQEGMLNLEIMDEREHVNSRMLAAATECSRVLEKACNQLEEDVKTGEYSGQVLDVLLFGLSVMAWENVALFANKVNDSRLHLQAVDELFLSAELFERTLRTIVASETAKGVTLRSQQMSMQLEQMVVNSHQYFCSLVGALARFEKDLKLLEAQGRDARVRSQLLIEKLTRAVLECDEILSHYPTLRSGKKTRISYDDQFSYHTKGDVLFVSSRYAFFWQVIKYLEESSVESINDGDVIRLCTLLKEVACSRQNSTKMQEAVDTILDRVLPGSLHRGQQLQGDDLEDDTYGDQKSASAGRRLSFRATSKTRKTLKAKKGRVPSSPSSRGRNQQRPRDYSEPVDDSATTSKDRASKLIEKDSKVSKTINGIIG